MRNAIYQKPDSPNPVSGSYNESLNYDKNGNIIHLDRYGSQDSDSNTIPTIKMDDLNYVYVANSNQLLQVDDATNSPLGFKDVAGKDYGYDANGNMIVDNNKGITTIVYNHLNLPTKISFANGGIISYFYNAMGQKVKKVVLENGLYNTTDYLTGYQYKNDVLLFFPTAEGYVNVAVVDTNCITCKPARIISSTAYKYAFNYVDHLGNVRLTYSQDPDTLALRIMEENHYYPFGLKHSGYNSDQLMYSKVGTTTKMRPSPPLFVSFYNYKYNGKELQDELGLNVYDYGNRFYDPARAGWNNIDPLAEQTPSWSPYSFCNNNPVRYTDPTGMSTEDPLDYYNNSGDRVGTDGVNDGRRAIVTDNSEARGIKRTDRSGGTTALSTVSSAVVLPSDAVLQESLNVLNRAVQNGGQREESSLVLNNGSVLRGQTGPEATVTNGTQTAPSRLPALPAGTTAADVESTIHSHPITVPQVGNQVFPQSASTPSTGAGSDGPTFAQYNTNIIVGPLGTVTNVTQNPNGTLNIPSRPNGAAIYNRDSTPRVELKQRTIERILSPRQ